MKQRPDGRWVKTIVVNGKREWFYSNAKTERAAENDIKRQLLDFTETKENGSPFSIVAERWKNEHFPTLENNSLKCYRPALKDVVEYFGDTRIRHITASDAEAFIASLVEKQYAKKTVSTRLLVLNLIFKYATIKGEVDANPCQYVKVPKNLKKEKREAPTKEELQVVKDNWNLSTAGFLAYFILFTGCRRGEALALTYGDIDMVRRVVKISKTAEWLGNVPNIKDHPKTDAGNREIPIPQILLEKLDDGKEHKSTELLFKSMRRSMITNSGVRRMWEMYQRKTGLDITLHQLRHAYATILYEAGIDVKAAQTFLGHANIQTTMDIYTHLSEAKKINSVDIIDKYLTTF